MTDIILIGSDGRDISGELAKKLNGTFTVKTFAVSHTSVSGRFAIQNANKKHTLPITFVGWILHSLHSDIFGS